MAVALVTLQFHSSVAEDHHYNGTQYLKVRSRQDGVDSHSLHAIVDVTYSFSIFSVLQRGQAGGHRKEDVGDERDN